MLQNVRNGRRPRFPRRSVQAERRSDLAMREGCATIDTRQLRLARPPDLAGRPCAGDDLKGVRGAAHYP
jgi:hypothetical protein